MSDESDGVVRERDGFSTPMSLLERMKDDDQEAWGRFARLYSPLVFHWCRRWGVLRPDAEDVLQEVFRAVAGGLSQFRREVDGRAYTFRAWLAGVTRNKLRDHRRSRNLTAEGGSEAYRRFQEVPEPALPDEAADTDEVAGVYQRALDLMRGEFEEATWRAFWRTAVDGLSAPQVADELGMTPAAVRKAKSRVLHRLKAEVGDLIG